MEVVGRAEAIDNGEGTFALDEVASIIDFYSDYFQVKYPMAKSSRLLINIYISILF